MNYITKRAILILAYATVISYLHVTLSAQEDDSVAGEDDIYELDTFEVYSHSQVTAAEAKRGANVIGSFLGTDAIGDLPDENLGDALSRLAGVNVVNDSEVSIRGLEGKLNSIRMDGVDLAQAQQEVSTSPGTDTRSFDVSSIPAEIVDSVEVIKSIMANQDADAIGGIVNVRTASAFNLSERSIRYKVEGRYKEKGDHDGYGFSLNYSDPISENFGIVLNASYRNEDGSEWKSELRQVEDPGTVPIPELERVDVRDTYKSEERFNLTGSLDWQISEQSTLSLKPYVSIRNTERFRNRIRLRDLDEREGNSRPFSGSEGVWWFEDANGNPLGNWVDLDGDGALGSAGDNFVPEGAIADEIGKIKDDDNIVITSYKQSADFQLNRRYEDRPEQNRDTYGLTLVGETTTDEFQLEYKLSYSDSTHDMKENRSDWTQGSGFTDYQRFRYDASDPYFPIVDAFVVTQDEGHIAVDPLVDAYRAHDRLSLAALRLREEKFEHEQWLAQIDFRKMNIIEKWDLIVGAKMRDNARTSRTAIADWEPDFTYTFDNMAPSFGHDLQTHDGLYSYLGPTLTSNDQVLDLFNSNPDQWSRNEADEFVTQAARFYDYEETITALYAMAEGDYGPLTILAGVRLEMTDQSITWKASEISFPGAPTLEDVTKDNDYSNLFPSVLGIYRFGSANEFVIRGAISTTIARPDYDDLVPFDTSLVNEAVNSSGGEGTEVLLIGNPNLSEQTAVNYDLSLEWYYSDRSNVSVGIFVKQLEDFLMSQSFTRYVTVVDEETGESELNRVTSGYIVNGGERDIRGMEFSWVHTFENLPDLFDGLGFVMNYTYIDGEQTEPIYDAEAIANGIFNQTGVKEGQGLQGQPENIFNFQGFYEKGPLNFRFAYTWVDKIKNDVLDVDFETFQKERGTMDASVQYRLNDSLRLFVEVKNITEEDLSRIYQTNEMFPESVQTDRRQWFMGLRGNF